MNLEDTPEILEGTAFVIVCMDNQSFQVLSNIEEEQDIQALLKQAMVSFDQTSVSGYVN